MLAAFTSHEIALLAALAYLLFKHWLADFCLQTPYQYLNKGRYLHPGGLLHSAIHAVLTLPLLLILPPQSPAIAALIVAAEFAVHYHIDWGKDRLNRAARLDHSKSRYWQLFGLDQLLHGLTYLAMVIALVMAAGA
jgi:Protein of unknown function (DUF3307)